MKKSFFIRLNFFNLELLTQDKNIPVVLQSSTIKILGLSIKGFLSYDQTYKQTNKDYHFIYICIYISIYIHYLQIYRLNKYPYVNFDFSKPQSIPFKNVYSNMLLLIKTNSSRIDFKLLVNKVIPGLEQTLELDEELEVPEPSLSNPASSLYSRPD